MRRLESRGFIESRETGTAGCSDTRADMEPHRRGQARTLPAIVATGRGAPSSTSTATPPEPTPEKVYRYAWSYGVEAAADHFNIPHSEVCKLCDRWAARLTRARMRDRSRW